MLRQRLREGSAFLPVVAMWEYLAVWLDEAEGAYGTSTSDARPRTRQATRLSVIPDPGAA